MNKQSNAGQPVQPQQAPKPSQQPKPATPGATPTKGAPAGGTPANPPKLAPK